MEILSVMYTCCEWQKSMAVEWNQGKLYPSNFNDAIQQYSTPLVHDQDVRYQPVIYSLQHIQHYCLRINH